MGEVLSKQCGEEEPAAASALHAATAAAAPAVEVHVPGPRRRVKVTPARLKTAATSVVSSGISSERAGTSCAAAQQPEEPPLQPRIRQAPAAQQGLPAAAGMAGCKRKAPETDATAEAEALAKRQQLLGLTILTLGALTGMAPFAVPRPPAAAQGADEGQQAACGASSPPAAAAAVQPAGSQQQQQQQGSGSVRAGQAAAGSVPEQQRQPQRGERGQQHDEQLDELAGSREALQVQQLQPHPHEAGQLEPQQAEQPEQEQQLQEPEKVAATPLPASCAGREADGEEEATPEAARLPPRPLSAAKPISRSQLRQQLAMRSQRAVAEAGMASPGIGAAAPAAGAVPAWAALLCSSPQARTAAGRSTRGQRLLSLARRQQHPPAASVPAADAGLLAAARVSAAVAEEGQQMQLDQQEGTPLAPAGRGQPGTEMAAAFQLAQRRLTQSPLSRPPAEAAAGSDDQAQGTLPASASSMQPPAAAAETFQAAELPTAAQAVSPAAAAAISPPPAAGDASAATPQPHRSSPSTPLTAEPSTTPRPAHGAAAGATPPGPSPTSPPRMAQQQPCSSAQSPTVNEGAVQAALNQVGALLADLRADLPQPPSCQHNSAPLPGPAAAADASPRQQHRAQVATANGDAAEDEAHSALKRAASPAQQQPGATAFNGTAPCSPPEVCSKPQEAGADNFPGFWRPPAAGQRSSAAGLTAGPAATTGAAGKSRKRSAPAGGDEQGGGEGQAADGGQGRERRVRFSMPERVEAAEAPAAAAAAVPAPEQQQPQGGPVPLVLAPPVLPGGGSGWSDGRPATPAKLAHLPMPQPPAFSRFGSTAFRRAYSGPQGRRQALLSFVSENGATCFAVPAGVPSGAAEPDGSSAEGLGGAPADQQGGSVAAAGNGSAAGSAAVSAAGSGELFIPRRVQHVEGLARRRSLQPAPPPPRGTELLEQEVREAYLNAKLAGHAGEPWARLDVAGCELALGGGHAETLEQLSSKLTELQGASVVQQLMDQVEAEWQHLKRMRQYATQGRQVASSAAAATAVAAPAGEPGPAAAEEAGGGSSSRPRGILKHRSSLSGSGCKQGTAGPLEGPPAEPAAAAEVRAEPAAEQQPAETATPATAAAAVAAAHSPPSTFEAVLAASIVHDPQAEPAALMMAAAAVAAAAAEPAPEPLGAAAAGAAAEAARIMGCQGESCSGPEPMDVDHPVDTAQPAGAAAQPAVLPTQPAAPVTEPTAAAAALPSPPPAAEQEAHQAAAAAAGDLGVLPAGEGEPEPGVFCLEPRTVELTPGPQLSRGAKMLQRCTPGAAGKVQQLLQSAAAEHARSKAAGVSPFAAPLKLLSAAGSGGVAAAAAPRRGMSRGERLLAALRGGAGAGAGAGATPQTAAAGGAPAGQPGGVPAGAFVAAQPRTAGSLPEEEEGPTVASAAAVVLGA